jgi:hypothetical protein
MVFRSPIRQLDTRYDSDLSGHLLTRIVRKCSNAQPHSRIDIAAGGLFAMEYGDSSKDFETHGHTRMLKVRDYVIPAVLASDLRS